MVIQSVIRSLAVVVSLLLFPTAITAQRGCNEAADLLAQARERARPGMPRDELERTRELLKLATRSCPSTSDAWYYRALYSRELQDQSDANYALQKAEYFKSEARQRGYNPFAVVARQPEAEIKLPPVREKYALIVGISQFQDRSIKSLNYSAKDAQDLATLLRDPNYGRFKPENVNLLVNEKATTRNIKEQIEDLSAKARPEDLVVLFFSTHGSARDSQKTDLNYLVTYDTEVSSLYATSLPMVNITEDVSKLIKAQRVVIMLDSCYSGAAALAGGLTEVRSTPTVPQVSSITGAGGKGLVSDTPSPPSELLSRLSQNVGRAVITASQPNELSWESDTFRNGYFTYFLMQALKQNQGLSPIDDVFRYVREQVIRSVRAERNQSQQPTMLSSARSGKLDLRIGAPPQPR